MRLFFLFSHDRKQRQLLTGL